MLQNKTAKEITGITNAPLSATDLCNMINGHLPYFEKLWKSAKENELYMSGENLTEQQRKAYHDKERGHFAQPIVADKLSRVIETQRNNKTSVKTEVSDSFIGGDLAFPDVAFKHEIKSEIFTMRCKKIEKASKFDQIENQVFTSGIGAKYGVAEVEMKYDYQGNPEINIVKRDYLDCIWDSNARDYDKEDGQFKAHRERVYRLDIRRDYGDKIANAISINESPFGRKAQQNWGMQDKQGKRDYDVIYIYRVWVKMIRTTYHLIFGVDDFKCTSRFQAEQLERLKKLPFILQNKPIPQSDIVEHPDYAYDYYETTFNQILKYEETDLESFPLTVYQSYFFEDKIWCLADLLKPNNKLMDKLISQIDYSIGTDIKNGWELVTSWVDKGISLEEAIRKVKAGEPLPVIRPGALNPIKQHGINPQWMEIIALIRSFEDQYTGGDLYSGVQHGKGKESAGAVAMKLKQQELVAMLPIGNLKYWKRNIFTKVVWFVKQYDTSHSIQKIHASELSKEMVQLLEQNQIYTPSRTGKPFGYVEINNPENELTMLKDAAVDIQVVEENMSSTQKIAQFQIMTQIEQSDPELKLSTEWRKIKLQLMDEVPYESRQKIVQEIEQAQQQQQQMAQQQQKEAINIEKAKVIASAK